MEAAAATRGLHGPSKRQPRRRREGSADHPKGSRGNPRTRAQVEKAWQYAFRDRKVKKREMRKAWIRTINAGARAQGVPYNRLVSGMRTASVDLNRKVLADLAISEPLSFLGVLEVVRANDP